MSEHSTQRTRVHADPRAYCDGKESFTTFRVADGIARRRRRNEHPGQVYRCAKCQAFHIGEQLGKRVRIARLRELEAEEAD